MLFVMMFVMISGEDDDNDDVCHDDDDYHFGERPKLEGETKNMSA